MDTIEIENDAHVLQAKRELAAALRWAARLGYQSGVCNHFSVAVPGRPDLMLINPEGFLWSEARASDLVIADHDGGIRTGNGHTVEQTAFSIHAPIHRLRPRAVAVLHTHMHHATAICLRERGVVSPSYLSAMSFYDRIVYDRSFDGAALTPAEGERLAGLLGDELVLMMQNHGPLVVGGTIGEALLRLVFLEDTCRMQILAEAGGHALAPIAPALLARVPRDVSRFKTYGSQFIAAILRTLEREEPEFAG